MSSAFPVESWLQSPWDTALLTQPASGIAQSFPPQRQRRAWADLASAAKGLASATADAELAPTSSHLSSSPRSSSSSSSSASASSAKSLDSATVDAGPVPSASHLGSSSSSSSNSSVGSSSRVADAAQSGKSLASPPGSHPSEANSEAPRGAAVFHPASRFSSLTQSLTAQLHQLCQFRGRMHISNEDASTLVVVLQCANQRLLNEDSATQWHLAKQCLLLLGAWARKLWRTAGSPAQPPPSSTAVGGAGAARGAGVSGDRGGTGNMDGTGHRGGTGNRAGAALRRVPAQTNDLVALAGIEGAMQLCRSIVANQRGAEVPSNRAAPQCAWQCAPQGSIDAAAAAAYFLGCAVSTQGLSSTAKAGAQDALLAALSHLKGLVPLDFLAPATPDIDTSADASFETHPAPRRNQISASASATKHTPANGSAAPESSLASGSTLRPVPESLYLLVAGTVYAACYASSPEARGALLVGLAAVFPSSAPGKLSGSFAAAKVIMKGAEYVGAYTFSRDCSPESLWGLSRALRRALFGATGPKTHGTHSSDSYWTLGRSSWSAGVFVVSGLLRGMCGSQGARGPRKEAGSVQTESRTAPGDARLSGDVISSPDEVSRGRGNQQQRPPGASAVDGPPAAVGPTDEWDEDDDAHERGWAVDKQWTEKFGAECSGSAASLAQVLADVAELACPWAPPLPSPVADGSQGMGSVLAVKLKAAVLRSAELEAISERYGVPCTPFVWEAAAYLHCSRSQQAPCMGLNRLIPSRQADYAPSSRGSLHPHKGSQGSTASHQRAQALAAAQRPPLFTTSLPSSQAHALLGRRGEGTPPPNAEDLTVTVEERVLALRSVSLAIGELYARGGPGLWRVRGSPRVGRCLAASLLADCLQVGVLRAPPWAHRGHSEDEGKHPGLAPGSLPTPGASAWHPASQGELKQGFARGSLSSPEASAGQYRDESKQGLASSTAAEDSTGLLHGMRTSSAGLGAGLAEGHVAGEWFSAAGVLTRALVEHVAASDWPELRWMSGAFREFSSAALALERQHEHTLMGTGLADARYATSHMDRQRGGRDSASAPGSGYHGGGGADLSPTETVAARPETAPESSIAATSRTTAGRGSTAATSSMAAVEGGAGPTGHHSAVGAMLARQRRPQALQAEAAVSSAAYTAVCLGYAAMMRAALALKNPAPEPRASRPPRTGQLHLETKWAASVARPTGSGPKGNGVEGVPQGHEFEKAHGVETSPKGHGFERGSNVHNEDEGPKAPQLSGVEAVALDALQALAQLDFSRVALGSVFGALVSLCAKAVASDARPASALVRRLPCWDDVARRTESDGLMPAPSWHADRAMCSTLVFWLRVLTPALGVIPEALFLKRVAPLMLLYLCHPQNSVAVQAANDLFLSFLKAHNAGDAVHSLADRAELSQRLANWQRQRQHHFAEEGEQRQQQKQQSKGQPKQKRDLQSMGEQQGDLRPMQEQQGGLGPVQPLEIAAEDWALLEQAPELPHPLALEVLAVVHCSRCLQGHPGSMPLAVFARGTAGVLSCLPAGSPSVVLCLDLIALHAKALLQSMAHLDGAEEARTEGAEKAQAEGALKAQTKGEGKTRTEGAEKARGEGAMKSFGRAGTVEEQTIGEINSMGKQGAGRDKGGKWDAGLRDADVALARDGGDSEMDRDADVAASKEAATSAWRELLLLLLHSILLVDIQVLPHLLHLVAASILSLGRPPWRGVKGVQTLQKEALGELLSVIIPCDDQTRKSTLVSYYQSLSLACLSQWSRSRL